jgi:hypothetical protein
MNTKNEIKRLERENEYLKKALSLYLRGNFDFCPFCLNTKVTFVESYISIYEIFGIAGVKEYGDKKIPRHLIECQECGKKLDISSSMYKILSRNYKNEKLDDFKNEIKKMIDKAVTWL